MTEACGHEPEPISVDYQDRFLARPLSSGPVGPMPYRTLDGIAVIGRNAARR
jgi:hypothetical protein